jgi:hypothetical protein
VEQIVVYLTENIPDSAYMQGNFPKYLSKQSVARFEVLTAVVMNSSVFWDVESGSALHLLSSSFLTRFILRS